MQHRFFKGILPPKYIEQMQNAPALIPISSGESIPSELLLSRAHSRFDSIANFETLNYIYKLLRKAATFTMKERRGQHELTARSSEISNPFRDDISVETAAHREF